MRCTGIHRAFVALPAAAVLAIPICSSAAATANPTELFQVPVRYVAGCQSSLFICWSPPPLTTVTPSANQDAPGTVTIATEPPIGVGVRCLDVSVNWRNLTTGATGTTVLRRAPVDYTKTLAPGEWCRYAPTTAVTGSGTIVAIADIGASAPDGGYQFLVSPGVGMFDVR